MPITVIQGEQRGDEGKGRFVDLLAPEHDIVARWGGADNAGHTIVLENGYILKLNAIPSGIGHVGVTNVIGNGVYLNAGRLPSEIERVEAADIEVRTENLMISSGAHLILPHHIALDEIREAGKSGQGSTKSGVSPVAADKYMRVGVRAEIINNDPDRLRQVIIDGLTTLRESRESAGLDQIDEQLTADKYIDNALKIGAFITDTALFLNQELRKPKPARILAEGAQAYLLDIDHGMYPFTTSSTPTSGGVAAGLGVPPTFIDRIIGVSKAVQSHVGGGPFITEITDKKLLARLHGDVDASDAERGTKTGRTRRLGVFDIPGLKRSQMINGTQEAALTKLDWVPRFGDSLKVCVAYERKGRKLEIAPDAAYKIEQSTAIYEELPNWDEEIHDVRKFEDLPENARKYVQFIEDHTGVPFKWIGVGQKPEEVIVR